MFGNHTDTGGPHLLPLTTPFTTCLGVTPRHSDLCTPPTSASSYRAHIGLTQRRISYKRYAAKPTLAKLTQRAVRFPLGKARRRQQSARLFSCSGGLVSFLGESNWQPPRTFGGTLGCQKILKYADSDSDNAHDIQSIQKPGRRRLVCLE